MGGGGIGVIVAAIERSRSSAKSFGTEDKDTEWRDDKLRLYD